MMKKIGGTCYPIFILRSLKDLDEEIQHIFWIVLSKTFERNYNSEAISHFLKFDILGYFHGNIPYSVMSKYVTSYAAREKLEYLYENAY